jgi:hypothetical protein
MDEQYPSIGYLPHDEGCLLLPWVQSSIGAFTLTLTCLADRQALWFFPIPLNFLLRLRLRSQSFDTFPSLKQYLTPWQTLPLKEAHRAWYRSLALMHPQTHQRESLRGSLLVSAMQALTVTAMYTTRSLPSRSDPTRQRRNTRSIADCCVTSQAISIAC